LYNSFMVTGPFLILSGVVLMNHFEPYSDRGLFTFILCIIGAGVGCLSYLPLIIIQVHTPPEALPKATSSVLLSRQSGATIGLALAGTVFSRITHRESNTESSFDNISTELLPINNPTALRDAIATIFNFFCLTGAISALLAAIFLVASPRLRISSDSS